MEPSVAIEYHADDYGLFPNQTRRILNCYFDGNLNGVSIMPNSKYLEPCMKALPPDVAVTIHLNLTEGKSLSSASSLTDKHNNLNASFGKLLLQSYLPGRKAIHQQVKAELRAQIQRASAYVNAPLRLDGHSHYHMLPVVFDALMEIIREDQLEVSYIRIPEEHLGIYLPHLKELHDFHPINLVKVAILNLLVARNRRKYGDYLNKLDQKLFLGVFLSGRMYRKNVEPLLPDAIALAQKKGWGIELLAHPGGVFDLEEVIRISGKADMEFLCDDMRKEEATMFEI